MKYIIVLLGLMVSFSAAGQDYGSSSSSFSNKMHSAYAALGFDQGGSLAIGGDYEYAYDRTFGLGGLLRLHEQDKEVRQDGITALGGFIRPHFNRSNWDLYVTLGASYISVDTYENSGREDSTGLGPVYGIGLLYQLTDTVSVGFDRSTYVIWFGGGDYYQGRLLEEAMARVRFNF